MYCFQKLTQFSKANNVLEAAASNRGDFLFPYTCVSSTQQIGLLSANRVYLHLQTPTLQEILRSKTNQ